MRHLARYATSLAVGIFVLFNATGARGANSMAPYVSLPLFMSNAVPPNILIIFDNSGSMNQMCYWEEKAVHDEGDNWWQTDIVPTTPYNPSRNYYGYFVSGTPTNRVFYTYSSNTFQRSPSGEWEGNFLNWLTMRRVDVARKVLVGGRATSRMGGGNTTLIGEDPAQSGRSYKCQLPGPVLMNYTPFNDGADRYVGVQDGKLYVSSDLGTSPFDKSDYQYQIHVQRDSTYPDEAGDFLDGNIAGVMQKVGDKATWGLEFFLYGTGKNQNGGYIKAQVGAPTINNLYTAIENESMQNWTPLAESYYVAVQYFKQNLTELQSLGTSTDSYQTQPFQVNNSWDPYKQNHGAVPCARSFVLLFTDGASTQDGLIPTYMKDYNGDNRDPYPDPRFPDNGSDYLDDVALYGKTNDLRSDLAGNQNLELFVVYAFGNEPEARQLLKDAARNGGFIDGNSNNRPDPVSGTSVVPVDYTSPPAVGDNSWSEWWADRRTDSFGAAMPDTYFEASDGYQLEQELIHAITKILERAGAGTAVSVLATSGEGEGALYQAYFRPKYSTATEDVYWTGYLQGLWLDAMGNLREDWSPGGNPVPDGILELAADPIVSFYFDEATGETKFKRTAVDGTHLYGDPNVTPIEHPMADLSPLWEAGSKLAVRDPSSRTIYTFVDLNNDGAVGSGEFISFDTTNQAKLKAYLDLANDPATIPEDFAYLGANENARVANLISYIRGSDTGLTGTTTVRNRTTGSSPPEVWKLGDIVFSTPMPLGPPMDNYDLIYGDSTYAQYYLEQKDRATAVYVGANDGMLHAFLAGTFHPGSRSVLNPGDGAKFTVDTTKYPGLSVGDELWAYIPQSLLPHLKWLADPNYIQGNHVYYVDLQPRIFDARIYEGPSNGVTTDPLNGIWTGMTPEQQAARPNGWCTILVGGMRLGGGSITVTGDFDNNSSTPNTTRTFVSSYFALDITEPNHPILLWERSYTSLGFTTSIPTVIKVDHRDSATGTIDAHHWYLIFGSGPTPNHYDGTSTQSGRIFVADLATGQLKRTFDHLTATGASLPANGFMGSPISVDVGLNYSVDVAYIGETHWVSSTSTWGGGIYRLKVPVTVDSTSGLSYYDPEPNDWALSWMVDATRPVTAAPAAAIGTADSKGSLWLYFGTGRYLSSADKTDTTQDYLFGVKDTYFNGSLLDSQKTALLPLEPMKPLSNDPGNFFDATGVQVFTDGSTSLTPDPSFAVLKTQQGSSDRIAYGWYRRLDLTGERIINKPAVLGGILLAPSFVPNNDVCGFGGDSYLYALYFETGTAYYQSVIGTEDVGGKYRVLDKKSLGAGLSSSLGIHVGREEGATGFVQQSTGTITEIPFIPAFKVKSGFTSWREVR
jgi:type IV pilus assembly protein PilY1